MFIDFKRTKVFYEVDTNGGRNQGCDGSCLGGCETRKANKRWITFFCGWGYGSEIIRPMGDFFSHYNKLYIDFPPFGKSGNIDESWTIWDYIELTKAIFVKEKIEKTNIIAHSFGGKVAILGFQKYNNIESLVLIGSAGIKPRKSISKYVKILRYKYLKKKGKNVTKFGSKDFLSLPLNARKTFVNIVNTHALKQCKSISAKTLIIAGKKDKDTPLYMQKKLHKNIKGSVLKVYDGGHYVWINNFYGVMTAICEFFNKGE